jgi:hypothetical protein
MKKRHKTNQKILQAVLTAIFVMTNVGSAFAHCDTLDGPVVADARSTLASGDVTPVLKWVSSGEEEEIKATFGHTLVVRKLGDDARNLADTYFFETLVRIHRAGEGAPYSGLKPGTSVDPAIALADEAIANKSVEKLSNVLSEALKGTLANQFSAVISSEKNADMSVEAGREYVQAYVEFTHFAEGIHGLIKGGAQHGEHK